MYAINMKNGRAVSICVCDPMHHASQGDGDPAGTDQLHACPTRRFQIGRCPTLSNGGQDANEDHQKEIPERI